VVSLIFSFQCNRYFSWDVVGRPHSKYKAKTQLVEGLTSTIIKQIVKRSLLTTLETAHVTPA
jgi:hypothetical protein